MTYKTAEERAAYARKWREKNRVRVREIDAQKRARKKEQDPTWAYRKMKEWRENNPEKAQAQAARQSASISERTRTDSEFRNKLATKRAVYMDDPDVRSRSRKKWREHAQAKRHFEPDYQRQVTIRYLYGLTLEQYEVMLAAQNGCCAICGTNKPKGRGGRLHIDHCHDCDQVRELLCHHCNAGLGAFKDNPDLLRAAAAYLERHRCP